MKKVYLLLILSLLLFTGCMKGSNGGSILNPNKTLTCTKEETTEEGYKQNEKIEVVYNSKKVVETNVTSIMETDPTYVDFAMQVSNVFAETLSEVEGITASYTKESDNQIKMVMKIEYDKLDPDQIKETLGDLYNEEDYYSERDYTIEEFKNKYLEEYECE